MRLAQASYSFRALESRGLHHYIQYMTVTKKGKRMARPRKSKIAENIRHHENTEIRLMAIFLEDAMRWAMKGNIVRAMSNIRLAAEYEGEIPTALKNQIYAEAKANG